MKDNPGRSFLSFGLKDHGWTSIHHEATDEHRGTPMGWDFKTRIPENRPSRVTDLKKGKIASGSLFIGVDRWLELILVKDHGDEQEAYPWVDKSGQSATMESDRDWYGEAGGLTVHAFKT